VCSI